MNITYDEMPKSVQKIYRFNNSLRKLTMILSWVLAIIIFLALRKRSTEASIFNTFHISLMLASVVHGFMHGTFIFRSVWKWLCDKLYGLSILFLLIAYFVEGVVFSFFCAYGFVFVIIDTIRSLIKKPLVYRWEHKYLLRMEKPEKVSEEDRYLQSVEANRREVATERLRNLNMLRAEGAITEEEYNAKKAEYLEKI